MTFSLILSDQYVSCQGLVEEADEAEDGDQEEAEDGAELRLQVEVHDTRHLSEFDQDKVK